MVNSVWLTLNGQFQGVISAGCSTVDSIGNKAQLVHGDQIMVMVISHGIHLHVPRTIDDSAGQPEESIELSYESISWDHHIAGTSAYSLWEERIF